LDLSKTSKVIGVSRGSWKEAGDESSANIFHREGIDLGKIETLESLAQDLAQCDALVNNAAVAFDGILATQSLISIEELVRVNCTSVLALTKLYVRERLALRKAGNVVTIGSIVAIRGYRGLAVYGATKGALISMTKAMAREMGPKKFRFNIVLPGFIETDMSQSLRDDQRQQIVRRTPLGRLARVEDVVPVVRFLLSDDSGFITGQEIVVDGGLTA
jgi:3-oxoacyl-[acyl-carrier protein] reductase